ncbi:right-handed parallel beta-helix repeat-containing protein [Kineococcus sp. SYSU DK003]|uniref:hypothetical protein n=1 Tax=Kineococcus sp. SYSU DK003 TaxID=3383124 RepID=UPI003D7E38EE
MISPRALVAFSCGNSRPSSRFSRTAAAFAVAAAVVVGGPATAPSAQAAVTPVMTYQGASVNSANVPATEVDLTTVTGVKFDRGTYFVNDVQRGTIDSVSVSGEKYSGTGDVDLTGYLGSVKVVAKLYSGKYMVQSITKYLRAVPLETSGIPEGFPTADTTGVPAGTVLTPSSDLDIWEFGAVLDGLDVQGCLTVHVPNVTVRNSKITCNDETLRAVSLIDAPGFVMEDSEIVSDGSAEVAIGWGGYTLRRVDIRGTQDGPRLGDNVVITDSYVHDLVRDPDVHTDAMQSTSGSNILVRHNTLDPRQQGSTDFVNSAVMLGTETGSRRLQNARFEGNFFNGGTYSVNVACSANVSDVFFEGNSFGHGSKYGAVTAPAGVTFTENRWFDTQHLVAVVPATC